MRMYDSTAFLQYSRTLSRALKSLSHTSSTDLLFSARVVCGLCATLAEAVGLCCLCDSDSSGPGSGYVSVTGMRLTYYEV